MIEYLASRPLLVLITGFSATHQTPCSSDAEAQAMVPFPTETDNTDWGLNWMPEPNPQAPKFQEYLRHATGYPSFLAALGGMVFLYALTGREWMH